MAEAAPLPRAPARPRLQTGSRSSGAFLRSDHVLAEDLLARLARRHHDWKFPAIHDGDTVGKRQHLVQLGGHEKNRLSSRTRFEQPLMDELDGSDVDTASRLRREQDREAATHLARNHNLLLISAGQGPRAECRVGGPDVERRNLIARVGHDRRLLDHVFAAELFLEPENEVVRDRVLEDEAAAMPVFGDVRESFVVALVDSLRRDVDGIDKNLTEVNLPQTGKSLDQLG